VAHDQSDMIVSYSCLVRLRYPVLFAFTEEPGHQILDPSNSTASFAAPQALPSPSPRPELALRMRSYSGDVLGRGTEEGRLEQ